MGVYKDYKYLVAINYDRLQFDNFYFSEICREKFLFYALTEH